MEDLSLHILDIAENSIAAGAKSLEISIREDASEDMLTIEIVDDGKGMSADELRKACNPFYTTRTTRKIGLGLALLDEAARAANGQMKIHSEPGTGTSVSATFQLSNIDRKPLGDIAETLVALITRTPEADIKYTHQRDGWKFVFDTRDVREILGELPINSPSPLAFIRKYISEHLERCS